MTDPLVRSCGDVAPLPLVGAASAPQLGGSPSWAGELPQTSEACMLPPLGGVSVFLGGSSESGQRSEEEPLPGKGLKRKACSALLEYQHFRDFSLSFSCPQDQESQHAKPCESSYGRSWNIPKSSFPGQERSQNKQSAPTFRVPCHLPIIPLGCLSTTIT